jgi:hypothetical protein
MSSAPRRTRLVLLTFVLLLAVPAVWVAATHPRVWHRPALWLGAFLIIAFVVGALVRRHRWAWWYLLTFADAVGVASILWEHVKPLAFIDNVVSLGLLLSPPMREYVRKARPPSGPTTPEASAAR